MNLRCWLKGIFLAEHMFNMSKSYNNKLEHYGIIGSHSRRDIVFERFVNHFFVSDCPET